MAMSGIYKKQFNTYGSRVWEALLNNLKEFSGIRCRACFHQGLLTPGLNSYLQWQSWKLLG